MPKAPKSKTSRVHPNSRAATHMARQQRHVQKVDRRYTEKSTKLGDLGDKLLWFQENIDAEKFVYTKDEARQLLEKYMDRFSEELEQIDIRRSIGSHRSHQHAARKEEIEFIIKEEAEKYNGPGFEIPDILNPKHFLVFKEWTQELRFISNIKLIKLKKTDELKPDKKKTGQTEVKPAEDNSEKDAPMCSSKKGDEGGQQKSSSEKNETTVSSSNMETE